METKLQAVRTRKTKSTPKWLNYVCTARRVQKNRKRKTTTAKEEEEEKDNEVEEEEVV